VTRSAEVAASLKAAFDHGTDATAAGSGRQWIELPLPYADGDMPTVHLAEGDSGELLLSDAGESVERLLDRGADYQNDRVGGAIREIAHAAGLQFLGGELRARVRETQDAGEEVLAFVAAMLQVDALAALAPPPRTQRFASSVVQWLRSEVPQAVAADASVRGGSGRQYRVTARIDDENPLIVQAVTGGRSARNVRGVEHTYTLFADVNGSIPIERKLAVVDRSLTEFDEADLRLLASEAFVAAWAERELAVAHLNSPAPQSERLLTAQGIL
jgi:hypothetical protein